jgi:hypothetical protein
MLNRRYLRIKVYQSLYAFWQSDRPMRHVSRRSCFLSIERTFDLYLSLLLMLSGNCAMWRNNASRTARRNTAHGRGPQRQPTLRG